MLAVAAALFYEEGVRAVGIDRVQQESGVARATIYRHFEGKDGLVVAFIEQRDEQWRAWFRERIETLSPDPAGRPLAAFDAIAERIATVGFRGCAFTNTIAEFPDPSHPAHAAASRHKQLVHDYLSELCDAASVDDPTTVAAQLLLLIDGAIVGAVRDRDSRPAVAARTVAALVLRAAQPHPSPHQRSPERPTRRK